MDGITFKSAVEGKRVLVDALNWDLKSGSGIATYSRTLCAALRAMGADVGMLFARETSSDEDPLVRAVNFHEQEDLRPLGHIRTQLRRVGLAAKLASWRGLRAHEIKPDEIVVLAPEQHAGGDVWNVPRLREVSHFRHLWFGRFSTVRLPAHYDVAHFTYPWPVRVPCAKRITTIHDLIPLRLPYATLDHKKEIVRRLRKTVAISDLIITVSEASKRDIIELLGVDGDKVAVTYQTSTFKEVPESESTQIESTLRRFGLKQDNYALFVSAIEPKKNLKRLIQAYLGAGQKAPLVVVGNRAWMWEEQIADAPAPDKGPSPIVFLDHVAQEDLRMLYAGARCLLFPSLYEGFGLPCLEAMQMGTPVLTSGVSSLPEVCGDAALYVDPFDVADIRAKTVKLMTDARLRRELVERGRVQAAKFSAERYQALLAAAYERVLSAG